MFDESAMVFRRYKSAFQITALAIVLIILVFHFYNNHQEKSAKLKAANIRHHELLDERNTLKREMEVLADAKANVEYSLMQKKLELTRVKNECKSANDELLNQANKFRSQSLTRYNSLDSEYQMIKANKEDLETDFKHLKQSFERLKAEHQKIRTTYEENVKDMKTKNNKVVSLLERQIEHYQKELAKNDGKQALSKQQKKRKMKRKAEDAGDVENDNAESKQESVEKTIHKEKKGLSRRLDDNDVADSKSEKKVTKDLNDVKSVDDAPKEAQVIEDNHFGVGDSDKALQNYKAKDFHENGVEETAKEAQNGGNVNEVKNEVEVAKETLNNDQKFADNDLQEENDQNLDEEDEEIKEFDEEKLLDDGGNKKV